jgi:uncharacterized membrane-anchored protein
MKVIAIIIIIIISRMDIMVNTTIIRHWNYFDEYFKEIITIFQKY